MAWGGALDPLPFSGGAVPTSTLFLSHTAGVGHTSVIGPVGPRIGSVVSVPLGTGPQVTGVAARAPFKAGDGGSEGVGVGGSIPPSPAPCGAEWLGAPRVPKKIIRWSKARENISPNVLGAGSRGGEVGTAQGPIKKQQPDGMSHSPPPPPPECRVVKRGPGRGPRLAPCPDMPPSGMGTKHPSVCSYPTGAVRRHCEAVLPKNQSAEMFCRIIGVSSPK